jgi:hypothetical protein
MRSMLRVSASAVAAAILIVGCGSDTDDSGGDTSGGGTSGGGTSNSGGSVTIDSFSVDENATCDGANGTVKADWTTSGAETVDFSVDGEPVPADAGQPTSGSGDIPVPCDGSSHSVEITATGSGGESASDSKDVSTSG